MVQSAASGQLNASADKVWALVGPFNNLKKFDPGVAESVLEEGGVKRRLDIVDSGQIVERLLNYDHAARSYRWQHLEIIDVPMPVINFIATISVAEVEPGKNCTFEMAATFDPAPGETEQAVEELMNGDFQGVIDNLQAMFPG
jgi:hypothetical protein